MSSADATPQPPTPKPPLLHTHRTKATRRLQFFTPLSHYCRSANDAVRIKVLYGDERGDAKDLQCFPDH